MITLYCIGPERYRELFISIMIRELHQAHIACSQCINTDADYSIIGVDDVDELKRVASDRCGIIDLIGVDSIVGIPIFRILGSMNKALLQNDSPDETVICFAAKQAIQFFSQCQIGGSVQY